MLEESFFKPIIEKLPIFFRFYNIIELEKLKKDNSTLVYMEEMEGYSSTLSLCYYSDKHISKLM